MNRVRLETMVHADRSTDPQALEHDGDAAHGAPDHATDASRAPSDASPETATAADSNADADTVATMSYRRAPKLPVFLVLGGALGAVVGMFVGVLGSGNAMFTSGQVVGYMMAIFALLGFAAGAVVALLLDRRSLKKAHDVEVEVEDRPAGGRPDVRD